MVSVLSYTTGYDLYFIVDSFPNNLRTAFVNTGAWPINAQGRFEFDATVSQAFTLLVTAQDPDGSLVQAMEAGGENLNITTTIGTFAPMAVALVRLDVPRSAL